MKPMQILAGVAIAFMAFGVGVRVGAPDAERAPVYGDDAVTRFAKILAIDDPNDRAVALGREDKRTSLPKLHDIVQ